MDPVLWTSCRFQRDPGWACGKMCGQITATTHGVSKSTCDLLFECIRGTIAKKIHWKKNTRVISYLPLNSPYS